MIKRVRIALGTPNVRARPKGGRRFAFPPYRTQAKLQSKGYFASLTLSLSPRRRVERG
jgi:hypothetical protein